MPPDRELIEAVATEIGVDPSFVEKDWYAMRLVAAVRHVHDLAALERDAMNHDGFSGLLRRSLDADATRGEPTPDIAALSPSGRVNAALEILDTEPEYAAHYGDFVRAMCYGTEDETPTFVAALEAVRRLGMRVA